MVSARVVLISWFGDFLCWICRQGCLRAAFVKRHLLWKRPALTGRTDGAGGECAQLFLSKQ